MHFTLFFSAILSGQVAETDSVPSCVGANGMASASRKPRCAPENTRSVPAGHNAIMLQNVADMTDVLNGMVQEGYVITPDVAATFSPQLTEHIKRFGEYVLDTEAVPPPLQPGKPFLWADKVSI